MSLGNDALYDVTWEIRETLTRPDWEPKWRDCVQAGQWILSGLLAALLWPEYVTQPCACTAMGIRSFCDFCHGRGLVSVRRERVMT